MFITIEDESGIANLILWPSMFEQNRRIVMGARMLGLYGQVQREGEVERFSRNESPAQRMGKLIRRQRDG